MKITTGHYSDKDGQKNPYHVTETRSIDYYAAHTH